jgi:hypothetical protein
VLDEKSRRKESFDQRNCVPVVLADGQAWHLPKPWLEVHPIFREGKAHSSYPVLTYGPELDALVKAMGECDDNSALLIGAASLGAYLLSQNYNLSDADLDQLFVFRIGDSSSRDWAMAVLQVATGQSGPKVSSGGVS